MCIAFSSTSEFLASGSSKGQVQVWDIRNKKHSFEVCENPTEQITGVTWKADDSIIVAITSTGLIYTINFAQKALQDILQYNEAPLRCLKFSYFKKNYLAASGDSGVVTVWDIKNNSLFHAFDKSSHSGPCTGVIFSPTNELLLCSGGLDAKIQFFDIKEKKTVKTIEANEPISTLSFYTDGVTIAAGTPTGTIYIYK